MAKRFLTLALAFVAMIAGIEGLHSLIAWRDGRSPTLVDLFWIACLPLAVWLWWRYVSPFGKGRGACLSGTADQCAAPPARRD